MRYIPVHDVASTLSDEIRSYLLAFRCLTGCDTTSQFSGIGNKRAWKVFTECPHLLSRLVKTHVVTSDLHASVEQFVDQLHSPSRSLQTIEDVRLKLFHQCKTLDRLPPTEDTLMQHVARVNYKSLVWHCSLECNPHLPLHHTAGWRLHCNQVKW